MAKKLGAMPSTRPTEILLSVFETVKYSVKLLMCPYASDKLCSFLPENAAKCVWRREKLQRSPGPIAGFNG